MRKLLYLCLLLAAVSPARAADKITVQQLEQRLAAEHSRSDKDLARRLENLQLTQRLSIVRLEKLEAALPGPESRTALLAVADLSEVLNLPPGEIPADLPPTAAEQKQILARAIEAAENPAANPLPDFDVTANITHLRALKYSGTDPGDPACRKCAWPEAMENVTPIPILVPVPVEMSHGIDGVAIREGRLITTHPLHAWAPAEAVISGAESWEGLHTVMSNLLRDMRTAQPEWARWVQGPTGKLAVFHFSVGEAHAHFPVRTFMDPQPKRGFSGNPGYRAEVTVDPATGAVHRFLIGAVLDPGQHVSRADVVVEFAPVNIDGNSFLGPLRAVTLGVSQSLLLGDYPHTIPDIRPVLHLVDVEFTNFRRGQSNASAAGDATFLSAAIQVAGGRVTVEQLQQLVADLRGRDDREVAHRLGQLELTQRLTAERHARLRDLFPGKASAEALLALYDLSAFADLPPSDLAPGNPPDPKLQGQIISSAVQFVAQVTHKMPDLFATRQLARFEDLQVVRGAQQPLSAEVKPLVMVDQSTGTVHFREGREVMETASKGARPNRVGMGLDTWGTFGPILEIVMTDVLNSKIGWSHWEHGPSGPLAVFRYAVPQDASHYDVRFCCYLADDGSPSSFSTTPGYHGELAIDPDTGAILRLVLTADLKPNAAQQSEQKRNPVLRSDELVEYGTIDIAGKKYICPMRSVSVMTTWTLGSQGPIKRPTSKAEGAKAAKKALALMEFSRVNAINEAVFRDYHVFRSEMRIVNDPAETGPAAPKQ